MRSLAYALQVQRIEQTELLLQAQWTEAELVRLGVRTDFGGLIRQLRERLELDLRKAQRRRTLILIGSAAGCN